MLLLRQIFSRARLVHSLNISLLCFNITFSSSRVGGKFARQVNAAERALSGRQPAAAGFEVDLGLLLN